MRLKNFFSYFGAKRQLAPLYNRPKYNMIIEPFAGSAGYSVHHYNPKVEVRLYDAYEPIIQIWNYLIRVSSKEIMSLPLGPFDRTRSVKDENICEEAKLLIAFWVSESRPLPSWRIRSYSRGTAWTAVRRSVLSRQVPHIRHWKAEVASYDVLDNYQATWFIDPPYQKAGDWYPKNTIDYIHLAKWSQERQGQVIVCEQEPASWLSFDTLTMFRNGSNRNYRELVWYNQDQPENHTLDKICV